MLGDSDELIEILSNTPVLLGALLADVEDERARAANGEGDWTIVEVVGHLLDAENRAIVRIEQFTSSDSPRLDPYDQNELVERHRYRDQALADVTKQFLATRERRLELLNSVPDAVWDKAGQHETLGPVTLRQITTHMCNHDVNHLAQIAKLLD